MKRIANFLVKHSGLLTAFVLMVGVSSAHSACFMLFHQPTMPKAMDAYRM